MKSNKPIQMGKWQMIFVFGLAAIVLLNAIYSLTGPWNCSEAKSRVKQADGEYDAALRRERSGEYPPGYSRGRMDKLIWARQKETDLCK